MSECVLAIDQGTTGTTVLVIGRALDVRGRGYQEFRQIYPEPGWVEHDPEDIWTSTLRAVEGALASAGVTGRDIAAIGITNQRETSALWDRKSGAPAMNAIVWQCRRSAGVCARLKAAGHEALVSERTGLVLDPYFSGTKLTWMFENVEGLRARAQSGALAFGTVDTFLTWRLTGGAAHVTDVSNASRTLLFDIARLAWDDELCALLGVPAAVLPRVASSAEVYGHTRGVGVLPDGIPIAGMAGDQQSALFGQACFGAGEAKCTYGTGAFLLVNTGERPVHSRHRVLTTVGWQVGGEVAYALEGSVFVAGAAVQWLRDGLGFFAASGEVEALARCVPDTGGVVFVPALVGLGAPHWRPEARGLIRGLTRGTTRAHIARAALEGVALSVTEVAQAMEDDMGRRITDLKVDGGAAANDLLMQRQADFLDVEVVRPAMLETTALGAAFLAGLGVGLWSGPDELRHAWREDRRFRRTAGADAVAADLARWREAVERA
jgi:glycerol kinase